ncbi:MAG: molybdopterin dinucleotide binding domain-containing protein, partial [Planctomycetota bacterium]
RRSNKSGYFELYSRLLAEREQPGLPVYEPGVAPGEPGSGRLALVTFRVNVQAATRTQGCAWLSEIHHETPAWLGEATAQALGLESGDRVAVTSEAGRVEITVRVTPGIVEGILGLAAHGGRWQGGRHAVGQRAPLGVDDPPHDGRRWWATAGVHANGLIAIASEPVGAQQPWLDTIVQVSRLA